MADRLDDDWQRNVSDDWRARRQYVTEPREKIARLEERARSSSPTDVQSFELGKLLAEFGREDEAIPHLAAVPRSNQSYAEANFILGHLMLGRGDEEGGVRHCGEAMARDPEATFGPCVNLYLYFNERGRTDEAEKYCARAERYAAAVQDDQR